MDNQQKYESALGGINQEDFDIAGGQGAQGAAVTWYICGGCGKDAKLDKDAGIRCQHCGHRIFYKKRERKLLQYTAR